MVGPTIEQQSFPATLPQSERDAQARLEASILQAADKHPELDRQIFLDMIDGYRATRVEHYNRTFALSQPKSGGLPDPHWLEQRQAIDIEFRQRMQADVIARSVARGTPAEAAARTAAANAAMEAASKEVAGPDMLERVTKPFYNPEKGGLQVGGIIGALVGFLCGKVITGEMGYGGTLMGTIGAVLAAGIGVWLGNVVGDTVKTYRETHAGQAKSVNAPAVGQSLQRSGDAPEQQKPVSSLANIPSLPGVTGGQDVTHSPTGPLYSGGGKAPVQGPSIN